MKRKERKAANRRAKVMLSNIGWLIEHNRLHQVAKQRAEWNLAMDLVINGILADAAPHYRAFVDCAHQMPPWRKTPRSWGHALETIDLALRRRR